MQNINILSALVFAQLIVGCGSSGSSSGKKCSDFSTQPDAQSYFESHNAVKLDADKDGIACEHLPNSLINQSQPMVSSQPDLELFIGDHTLIGESCKEDSCTLAIMTLKVPSASQLSVCFEHDIQGTCVTDKETTYPILAIEDDHFRFAFGTVLFGTPENGLVDLIYVDNAFAGQNILMTDFSKSGAYDNNGVLRFDDGQAQLTSYSGRTIYWDNNEITVSTANN